MPPYCRILVMRHLYRPPLYMMATRYICVAWSTELFRQIWRISAGELSSAAASVGESLLSYLWLPVADIDNRHNDWSDNLECTRQSSFSTHVTYVLYNHSHTKKRLKSCQSIRYHFQNFFRAFTRIVIVLCNRLPHWGVMWLLCDTFIRDICSIFL
jgi:hypothetical protein